MYFSSILSKDLHLDDENQNKILNTIPSVISVSQNEDLVTIPNVEEIEEVILTLPAKKTPAPHSFTSFSSRCTRILLKMTLSKWSRSFWSQEFS